MPANEGLTELTERKRLLILEADLHRSVIGMERANIRARLSALDEVRQRAAAGGPWLLAGSAVAGLIAVRKWRSLAQWIPMAFTAVRWMRALKTR